MTAAKDNAGFIRKRQIRANLLRVIEHPIVLETHAGYGKLYEHLYTEVPFGIAIDKKPDRAEALSLQRPDWAIYEADAERGLREGLAARWPVTFLDIDPYGDPWPTILAFFGSERERAARMVVVVNDGLRQATKMGISWNVGSLRSVVERRGNAAIYNHYLEVAEELLTGAAALAGYRVEKWTGYYTGHAQQMTHYGAVLARG